MVFAWTASPRAVYPFFSTFWIVRISIMNITTGTYPVTRFGCWLLLFLRRLLRPTCLSYTGTWACVVVASNCLFRLRLSSLSCFFNSFILSVCFVSSFFFSCFAFFSCSICFIGDAVSTSDIFCFDFRFPSFWSGIGTGDIDWNSGRTAAWHSNWRARNINLSRGYWLNWSCTIQLRRGFRLSWNSAITAA